MATPIFVPLSVVAQASLFSDSAILPLVLVYRSGIATFIKYFLDGILYRSSSLFSSFQNPGRSTMLKGIISFAMKCYKAFVICCAHMLPLGYGCVRSMTTGSVTCSVLLECSGVCFFPFDSFALVTVAYSFV